MNKFKPVNKLKATLSPGMHADGPLYVYVNINDTAKGDIGKRSRPRWALSITGVVGPRSNGNARGSCGQCVGALGELRSLSGGWTPETVAKLKDVWEQWHLNDMRAGCSHQRAAWDVLERLEIVSYKLTQEASRLRHETLEKAAAAGLRGEPLDLDPTARALAELKTWYRDVYQPPDADSPLSGCYEVSKRETRAAGWVRPEEHSRGLLCKPCETCGYKYGSAWLFEPLPPEVVTFLRSLPTVPDPAGWPNS